MAVIVRVASGAFGIRMTLMTETAIKLHLVFLFQAIQHWVKDTKLAQCVPVMTAVMEYKNTDTSAALDANVMHFRF